MNRKWLRRVVTWVIALLALAFVIHVVPFHDHCDGAGEQRHCEPGLWTSLRQTSPLVVVALFAVYLFGTLAWAARWRALLKVAGAPLPLLRVWRVTLEAQAGGILLPGGVAGDALRLAYVRTAAPDAELGKIVASLLADRVVGLVTLSGLATLAGVAFGVEGLGKALPILGAIPVGAVLGWLVLRMRSVREARFVQTGIVSKVARPLLEYVSAESGPRALLQGLVFSLVVSGIQLLVMRGLVAALHAQPMHEGWIFVGTTLSMIVAAVPALPGGWGTADAAYVLFFGKAGIAASVAAAACLLYRMFWYASGIVGAVLALARRERSS